MTMKMILSVRKAVLFAASLVLAAGMGLSNQANAQSGYYYGNPSRSHYGSRSYYNNPSRSHAHSHSERGSGPVYHGPSLHYDRAYHADSLHWTPRRGLHTHGHYDAVPHYTPGHYDYQHRGHIHGNPNYHR